MIVILILAAISITMLTGDNSILKRAVDAKERTERAEIIESAKTDILGQIAENKGGKLKRSQLRHVLGTYFKDIPSEEYFLKEGALADLDLTTLDKYGKYTIKLSEIYGGDLFGIIDNTSSIPEPIDPTNIYVILYNDYTLCFNTTGNLKEGKKEEDVLKRYDNIANKSFTSADLNPWYADGNCTKIKYVEFLEPIAPITVQRWFLCCENLEKIINIEYLNTCNVINMNRMFMKCYKINEIDVSHFNTSAVTDMSQMFQGCSEVEKLDLDEFDTSKVTDINYMFQDCIKLKRIDVGCFNTSNVTLMMGVFEASKSYMQLEEIIGLNKWNTNNVTMMTAMFQNCPNLANVDLSSFNTSNVTDMTYMFLNCKNLETIDLSSFNTSNVIDMSYMFAGCTNLKKIEVISFDTSKVTTSKDMFKNCTKLVGGQGTKYNSRYINHSYAHIDGGEDNPGYFTSK